MRYLVVIEESRTGYSAYLPDLDGCVAVGTTREDVERNMRGSIELHLQGLREDGIHPPPPTSSSTYVEIPA